MRSSLVDDKELLGGLTSGGWRSCLRGRGRWQAKTPPEVVTFLDTTLDRILAEPATVERLRTRGLEPRQRSPDEIRTIIRTDLAAFGAIVEAGNIKADRGSAPVDREGGFAMSVVTYETSDDIAVVTIDQPERRNAPPAPWSTGSPTHGRASPPATTVSRC